MFSPVEWKADWSWLVVEKGDINICTELLELEKLGMVGLLLEYVCIYYCFDFHIDQLSTQFNSTQLSEEW